MQDINKCTYCWEEKPKDVKWYCTWLCQNCKKINEPRKYFTLRGRQLWTENKVTERNSFTEIINS